MSGFTDGVGVIWFERLECNGTEKALIDCPHSSPASPAVCSHFEDAGVSCSGTTCTQGAIRLRGGTVNRGRMEICNSNVWGTVCDNGWDDVDAKVACFQLGLPSSGT